MGCLCNKNHPFLENKMLPDTYGSEEVIKDSVAVSSNPPNNTAINIAGVFQLSKNIYPDNYKGEYMPQESEFTPPVKETFFSFDSDKLSQASKENIALFANGIKNKAYNITIQGHTDSIGSKEYNMRLSLKRAKAVKEELVKNGLDAFKIEVIGYGLTRPIADNSTAEGRARNRRTVMFAEVY